jgi:hypothetical protein
MTGVKSSISPRFSLCGDGADSAQEELKVTAWVLEMEAPSVGAESPPAEDLCQQ